MERYCLLGFVAQFLLLFISLCLAKEEVYKADEQGFSSQHFHVAFTSKYMYITCRTFTVQLIILLHLWFYLCSKARRNVVEYSQPVFEKLLPNWISTNDAIRAYSDKLFTNDNATTFFCSKNITAQGFQKLFQNCI